MSIAFACSQCGKRYSVKNEMAGKKAKCGCGNELLVPRPQTKTPAQAPSLLDDLPQAETAAPPGPPGNIAPSFSSPPAKPSAAAKLSSKDRGANVRRNLRRWWKILAAITVGWFLLSLIACIGAVGYAAANNLSQRRIESLGQGFGTVSAILLVVIWLVILVIADRVKPQ